MRPEGAALGEGIDLPPNVVLDRSKIWRRGSAVTRSATRGVSPGLGRSIEQRQLVFVGWLEGGSPLVKVFAADRRLIPRRYSVAPFDALPEFIGRRVEVVEFDADTETTSGGSHLVTLDPSPEPEVKHDALTKTQEFLGQEPQPVLELLSDRPVPGASPEIPEPLVLREADRSPLTGEPHCEGGLARPGQTTSENEPRLDHDVIVQQVGRT